MYSLIMKGSEGSDEQEEGKRGGEERGKKKKNFKLVDGKKK